MLSPSSGRRVSLARNQREAGGKKRQHSLLVTCFTLVSCLAYSSTLKMEGTPSSETWVDFQRTIWRYVPENRTLQLVKQITLSALRLPCAKLHGTLYCDTRRNAVMNAIRITVNWWDLHSTWWRYIQTRRFGKLLTLLQKGSSYAPIFTFEMLTSSWLHVLIMNWKWGDENDHDLKILTYFL
jgi:hypothetical protein